MIRRALSALALSPALMGSPAWSEDWRHVSKVGEVAGYIDRDSIERKGDKVRFWMELRLPEARTAPTGARFNRLASLIEIHCRSKTYRALRVRADLGEQLVHESKTADRSAKPIRPDTPADHELRAVCFDDWASGG